MACLHHKTKEHVMKTTSTTTAPAAPDPLTIAYIAYGLRDALSEGLEYDDAAFEGESGLMAALIEHASALDAEFLRRYGPDGIRPEGAAFVFYYDVAEEFGRKFAWALAEYKHEDATPIIKRVFDAADPEFAEPQVPAYDMNAIRVALLDHALEQATRDPELIQRMLVKGTVGLDNRSDEELVELYRSALKEEPPMLGNESSTPDDIKQAA